MGLFDKILDKLPEAFKYTRATLGFGYVDSQPTSELTKMLDPSSPLSFTDPTAQMLMDMAWAQGIPQFTQEFELKKAEGTLTEEDMSKFYDNAIFLGQIQSGTVPETQIAAFQALDLISAVAGDVDYGSMDFLTAMADLGAAMSPTAEVLPTNELVDLNLRETQIRVERAEFEFRSIQQNYERQGIMDLMGFLPTSARLPFISKIMQTPKYSNLFFGGGGNPSDGPYVGGTIDSISAPGIIDRKLHPLPTGGF